MKKIIFIFVLMLIPVLMSYAQDKNAITSRENTPEKYCTKEANCPECQGWGWLISVTYKLGNANSRTGGNDASLARMRNNGNLNTILQRVKCYYCGGTGKIRVQMK